MAIPSSMRKFLVVTNWPRVVVDTLRSRQRLRSLNLAGEESPDANLARIRQASNLDAHLSMFLTDTKVYGRGFLSCGSNETNPKSPLIRAESPRQVAAEVDVRTEMMTAAALRSTCLTQRSGLAGIAPRTSGARSTGTTTASAACPW
jgi:hypothetical protein